jgi:hypothetical protein
MCADMATAPPLHPNAAALAFLLGDWEGEGEGAYLPSVAPFRYREQVRFWHAGKPFLAYTQRTVSAEDARPLHAEMGYWRCLDEGAVELVLAHPTGFAEIALGSVAGQRITLRSSNLQRTPTAKEVTALEREVEVEGDVLRYRLGMGMHGQPVRWHLSATLHKVDA